MNRDDPRYEAYVEMMYLKSEARVATLEKGIATTQQRMYLNLTEALTQATRLMVEFEPTEGDWDTYLNIQDLIRETIKNGHPRSSSLRHLLSASSERCLTKDPLVS